MPGLYIAGWEGPGRSWPREGTCLLTSWWWVPFIWCSLVGLLLYGCPACFPLNGPRTVSSPSYPYSIMSLITFTPSPQCQQNSNVLYLTPYSTLQHHLLITTIIYQPARLPRTESWFHHLQIVRTWVIINNALKQQIYSVVSICIYSGFTRLCWLQGEPFSRGNTPLWRSDIGYKCLCPNCLG